MWQAYKQGIGVGLGLLTVYALALLLLALLVRQSVAGGTPAQPPAEGGPRCSTSWA
ncbi:hypothetical protein [Thermus tengchongensis]|uniref:hypothetical protein n=1 Tax=Thermus tengchongensis TaxID=1214928 RepID=UPI001F3552EA|nr:hypothetical protein [Thermus tengchongensis]